MLVYFIKISVIIDIGQKCLLLDLIELNIVNHLKQMNFIL
jgi:hypothetical protein